VDPIAHADDATLAPGVIRMDRFSYRGKRYQVPIFDPSDPVVLRPRPLAVTVDRDHPVIRSFDTTWDLAEFRVPRRPVSVGLVPGDELGAFGREGVTRVLDMPIKLPDVAEYRLPRALAQFSPVLQRIVDFENAVHPANEAYFAYLTIDQGWVGPGTLHREAPCHVDGFQGARWSPKCLVNHTYTVSDRLPTAYYAQPFDFTGLDERVHDFFWEMNAQVADTNEAHKWQPAAAEITLMDAYCVHRGVEAEARTFRTWLRLSFEERRRVFDRLGNAHNPLFDYAWEMVERDIEQLGLRAFRATCDPSLRVFPWQSLDGGPLPPGAPKTKPRLRAG
jgi:hypothetical protein